MASEAETNEAPVGTSHSGVITRETYSPKDASHVAFYAGFAKGMASAFDGMILFASSKSVRAEFWSVLRPFFKAQIAYGACGVLIFLLLRDPADDLTELLWTMSRWGRMITVVTTFVLQNSLNVNSRIFYASLKALNPEFGAALEQKEKAKKSLGERWRKFKHVAKLSLFKAAGAIINKLIPGGKFIAVPAVKFVSLRPVLGTPGAAGFAAIHALPSDVLESSRVDDALISLGEAVIDAEELGTDSTKPFSNRLDGEETRLYFADRYRGYITGCGFVYSLLESVPFLGIPATLIAECGAACVVTDIVKRNLEKDNRRPFVCEEKLQHAKTS